MPKIALIKTSSMGDVVHNLPVVSDLLQHYPNAEIDWVVEEAFAAIPAMHPGVRNVIPVAIRRWRRSPLNRTCRREMSDFRNRLRASRYDLVLDTQGLFKSAVIACLARGTRCGYDLKSAREPIAALCYDFTRFVEKQLHAVERNRLLAARCMGYSISNPLDYGLKIDQDQARAKYAVLLHATSRDEKLWAEPNWIALGIELSLQGFELALPWGSERERERAERLARQIPGARVPERLGLVEAADLLGNAEIVIGVDTGLAHLAAALGTPVVGIYCATDPGLTGILSAGKGINLGGKHGAPQVSEALGAIGELL